MANLDEQIDNILLKGIELGSDEGQPYIRYTEAAVDDLVALIAQETTKAINDYQTNEEQKHIASAVALARIEETKLWYNDWGNGKEQIGDGSWEDFYEWRIAKLKGDDK